MAPTTTASWLAPAFARTVKSLGATAGDPEITDAAQRLLNRWSSPERRFHSTGHLVDLLQRVDQLQQETHKPNVVRVAAWYHGAVFNPAKADGTGRRPGEDEAASAEYARKELTDLGIPEPTIERVAQLVRGLSGHEADPKDIDAAVICDADLAILACEPQRYKEYLTGLREEYAHIPDDVFWEARRTVVEKLLSRERLYQSPLGAQWETAARQNLTAELARLTAAQTAAIPVVDDATVPGVDGQV